MAYFLELGIAMRGSVTTLARVIGALAWLLACAAGAGLQAQEISFRLAGGPAYGGAGGAVGMAGVQVDRGGVVVRLEARGVATGRSADWERSARVVGVGLAGGVHLGRTASGARPYALLAGGEGLDPREADHVTWVGGGIGIGFGRGDRFFGELRYERWLQHGVEHHDLPDNLLTAMVGITLR